MGKIKVKNIKVGEEYFFPNDDFTYHQLFKVWVSKERINKIIGNEFSTKNVGWNYERERCIGFKTEEEAKKYLIKQLKKRKDDIDEEYKNAVESLKNLN